MNNDRSDFRLRTLQRTYVCVDTGMPGFMTLFADDIRGMRKLRRELLIHDHYGAWEGMSRVGAKGCSVEVTRSAGTKQDVNLARKTLFSPGKVVNGRLGSRSRWSARARIAYELVLQDKSGTLSAAATLSSSTPACGAARGGSALCRANERQNYVVD